MNKLIITVLLTTILIMGFSGIVLWVKYKNITATPPDKIEMLINRLTGTGKLVLAEEGVYNEYIKKFERGPAKAKVLFRWLTTFQYMIDLQNPQFRVIRNGNKLKINSPAITVNEPAIDITRYKPGIVIEGSIWINEQKLINDEMRHFKYLSFIAGKELIKNPEIIKLCTDQIKLTVLKITSGLQMQVDDVEVVFSAE